MSATLKTLLGFWISVLLTHGFAIKVSLAAVMARTTGAPIVVTGSLVGIWLFWRYVKRALVRGIPTETQFNSVPLSEVSGLYTGKLTEYCQDLISLGFQQIHAGQLAAESGGQSPNFVFHFSHPNDSCYATVFQTVDSNQNILPVSCSIISFFQAGELLATTQLTPTGISSLWGNPKHFWTYLSDATAKTLFDTHLDRRQTLTKQLRLPIMPRTDWDFYAQWEYQQAKERKQRLG
ncbi:MAG: hypothetical protein F6K42_19470 [Leptolyngbya sp. SIO1D8]|nr:hypothetical protein [Leptolyngbya sp. SIO1D8]